MRKNNSRKYNLAVALCVVLLVMSMCYDEMIPALILCALAAMVACVWIMCESMVDRAAAPLNLHPEHVYRVDKPPEAKND